MSILLTPACPSDWKGAKGARHGTGEAPACRPCICTAQRHHSLSPASCTWMHTAVQQMPSFEVQYARQGRSLVSLGLHKTGSLTRKRGQEWPSLSHPSSSPSTIMHVV